MATTAQSLPVPVPVNGLRADLDDFLVPPTGAIQSQNWLLRDGKMQVRPGLTTYAGTTRANIMAYTLYQTLSGNSTKLVQASATGMARYDITTHAWVDITQSGNELTSATLFLPVLRQFQKGGNNYVLHVNLTDIPKKWKDGDANYTDFGGSAPIAGCICVVGDHILLGRLPGSAGGDQKVDVSAFQDFDSGWGATETAILSDTPGSIMSMNELSANSAAIYKSDAVYVASATGSLTPIRFDLRQAGIEGPASFQSVVTHTSGVHFIFGRYGGLYTFDGNIYTQHPASEAVRQQLRKQCTGTVNFLITRRFGVFNASHNEMRYYFPSTDDFLANKCLVLNLSNNSVWIDDHPTLRFGGGISCRDPETGREQLYLGASTGQTYTHEGTSDNSAAITHYLQPGVTDFGDQSRWKHIPEVVHSFYSPGGSQTVSIQLQHSVSGEDITLSPARAVTAMPHPIRPYTTPFAREVVYGGLRLSGSTTRALQWRGSRAAVIMRGYANG